MVVAFHNFIIYFIFIKLSFNEWNLNNFLNFGARHKDGF